jgi:hypothetical protein
MADIVTIWNMALANIGSTAVLLTQNDNAKAAVQCNLWWATARDYVLRAYPWPFAEMTVTLAQIPTATYQPPDYQYAFGVPADCVRALELLSPAGRRPPPGLRIPWKLRSLPNGGGSTLALVTDMAPGVSADLGFTAWGNWGDGWWVPNGLQPATPMPCLRYTSRIIDPTVYPPEVAEALAWQLASYLAVPMTQQKELKADAVKMAEMMIRKASALNLNEQQADPPLPSDPTIARL